MFELRNFSLISHMILKQFKNPFSQLFQTNIEFNFGFKFLNKTFKFWGLKWISIWFYGVTKIWSAERRHCSDQLVSKMAMFGQIDPKYHIIIWTSKSSSSKISLHIDVEKWTHNDRYDQSDSISFKICIPDWHIGNFHRHSYFKVNFRMMIAIGCCVKTSISSMMRLLFISLLWPENISFS